MSRPRYIAVLDVGKTNAKLALVDAKSLTEVSVVTRSNSVVKEAPYPHFDLEGHWAFFIKNLAAIHKSHGVDAISVTTHGASGVLLDAQGNLATSMLDYEHFGPDSVAEKYNAIRPDFSLTGSARLPVGLNLGAQIHWLFELDPTLKDRTKHIVTYPQYWGFRLTGAFATDVSSLGCHTDLWEPRNGRFSSLVKTLGIEDKIAPARKSSDILGTITPEVAELTGLKPDTPVVCGIHDSNASLLPHLQGRDAPFSVVSTGTWVIVMAVGAEQKALNPARDTLINVSAFGDSVPSARFMGGREYELVRDGSVAVPTLQDRERVLEDNVMLLPAVVTESGPFAGRDCRWTVEPQNDGERAFALSLYLALMTYVCLDLIGARGGTIVEGPFAQNQDFLSMLAQVTKGKVQFATSATGTSVGAAMLFGHEGVDQLINDVIVGPNADLAGYASAWLSAVET